METKVNNTYWPPLDIYNPNLDTDTWIEFLHEDKKNYPSTLKLLNTILAFGGESTVAKLAKTLNVAIGACNSRASYLGKRIKEYYHLPPCLDNNNKEWFVLVPFIGRNVRVLHPLLDQK